VTEFFTGSAMPGPSFIEMATMRRSANFLLSLFCVVVCFDLISAKADDTCKSARDQLSDELKEKLGAPRAQIVLLSIDTLKPIGTSGGETGYECIGRANVQRSGSGPTQTVKFIYSVINGRNLGGYQGIDFSIVGIAYVCGEDKQWDQIYPACLK
jgi:hypothetical protein